MLILPIGKRSERITPEISMRVIRLIFYRKVVIFLIRLVDIVY